jgi:hypothetical protein
MLSSAAGPRYHQSTRFEVKELAEINMVPMARLAGTLRELPG